MRRLWAVLHTHGARAVGAARDRRSAAARRPGPHALAALPRACAPRAHAAAPPAPPPPQGPCQHNFCLACFKRWYAQGKKSCPTCRAAFPAKFAENPRINTVLTMVRRMGRAHGAGAWPGAWLAPRMAVRLAAAHGRAHGRRGGGEGGARCRARRLMASGRMLAACDHDPLPLHAAPRHLHPAICPPATTCPTGNPPGKAGRQARRAQGVRTHQQRGPVRQHEHADNGLARRSRTRRACGPFVCGPRRAAVMAARSTTQHAPPAPLPQSPDEAFTTDRAQRAGRANAASGRIMVTVPNDHFGPILPEHDPEQGKVRAGR